MLKNIKVKNLSELNFLFKTQEKICETNKEFTLPLLFKNFYIEKIMIIDKSGMLSTVNSITYDEVKQ